MVAAALVRHGRTLSITSDGPWAGVWNPLSPLQAPQLSGTNIPGDTANTSLRLLGLDRKLQRASDINARTGRRRSDATSTLDRGRWLAVRTSCSICCLHRGLRPNQPHNRPAP
jgi:hypothetical protein